MVQYIKNFLSDFSWGSPSYGVMLFVCVIVLVAMIYRLRVQIKMVHLLAGMWYRELFPRFSITRRIVAIILLTMSMLFLIIALMRPQWKERYEQVKQEGRDIYIALDISRSMLAADVTPNRLFCAKNKIKSLLSHLTCERVGLILFASKAYICCPLTTDYRLFYSQLDTIDAQLVSGGVTALDQAILCAVRAFELMPERKTRLCVVFTDGEDFSSDLSACISDAQKKNTCLFAVGIGTQEGAPVPIIDVHGAVVGHERDGNGAIVMTSLNEKTLQMVTTSLGGVYVKARQDIRDVQEIVRAVHCFEREQFDDISCSIKNEFYHYFLMASGLCCALEWLLI